MPQPIEFTSLSPIRVPGRFRLSSTLFDWLRLSSRPQWSASGRLRPGPLATVEPKDLIRHQQASGSGSQSQPRGTVRASRGARPAPLRPPPAPRTRYGDLACWRVRAQRRIRFSSARSTGASAMLSIRARTTDSARSEIAGPVLEPARQRKDLGPADDVAAAALYARGPAGQTCRRRLADSLGKSQRCCISGHCEVEASQLRRLHFTMS